MEATIDPPAPVAEASTFLDTLARDIGDGKFDANGNLKDAVEPPAPAETPPPAVVETTPKPDEKPVVEEAKKPEEAGEEDIPEAPENLSTKAKADWDKIKGSARNYKEKSIAAAALLEAQQAEWATERAELQRKFEEASATSSELVELRQKREAFEAAEKEFSVYSVERTAEFQNTIARPLGAIEERIQGIADKASVKEVGVTFDDLADAVAELDDTKQSDKLEALLPSLSTVDAAKVLRMAEDARGLLIRRREILDNADKAQKELKERSEKETTAQRETASKEFKSSVKNTVDSLVQRLPFVELAEGETKEGVFKSILDKAEAEDFDQATPTTKGTAAVSVIALERATRQLQKQAEYIKTLEARVAEGNSAAPSLGGNPVPPPAPKQEGGLMDGVNALLKLGNSRPVGQMEIL
jgi:hypothetical protein